MERKFYFLRVEGQQSLKGSQKTHEETQNPEKTQNPTYVIQGAFAHPLLLWTPQRKLTLAYYYKNTALQAIYETNHSMKK